MGEELDDFGQAVPYESPRSGGLKGRLGFGKGKGKEQGKGQKAAADGGGGTWAVGGPMGAGKKGPKIAPGADDGTWAVKAPASQQGMGDVVDQAVAKQSPKKFKSAIWRRNKSLLKGAGARMANAKRNGGALPSPAMSRRAPMSRFESERQLKLNANGGDGKRRLSTHSAKITPRSDHNDFDSESGFQTSIQVGLYQALGLHCNTLTAAAHQGLRPAGEGIEPRRHRAGGSVLRCS